MFLTWCTPSQEDMYVHTVVGNTMYYSIQYTPCMVLGTIGVYVLYIAHCVCVRRVYDSSYMYTDTCYHVPREVC